MPKLSAIAALVMAAAFCCAEASPASAQVMKNFPWNKKQSPKKAKPHDAAAPKPAETGTGQAPLSPKRQQAKPKN